MTTVCFVDEESMAALRIHCRRKYVDIIATKDGSICIVVLEGKDKVIQGIIKSINGSNTL